MYEENFMDISNVNCLSSNRTPPGSAPQVQRPLGPLGRFRSNVEKEGAGQDARSGLVRLQRKILRPRSRPLPPDGPVGREILRMESVYVLWG